MPSLAATSSSSATPTAPANGQSPSSKPSATTSPSSRPPRNTRGFSFQDTRAPRRGHGGQVPRGEHADRGQKHQQAERDEPYEPQREQDTVGLALDRERRRRGRWRR